MKKNSIHTFSTIAAFAASAALSFTALGESPAAAPQATATAAANATPAAAATPAATPAAAELTVEGTVKKVVAKKKEIYLMPADGGKKMEFYFPKDAQYLKGGQPVEFNALKEGQKVRVTYTKKGKRLNPSKAEILE
jgi:hypothetical protein